MTVSPSRVGRVVGSGDGESNSDGSVLGPLRAITCRCYGNCQAGDPSDGSRAEGRFWCAGFSGLRPIWWVWYLGFGEGGEWQEQLHRK